MIELESDKYKLKELGKINIILGKNGCGKSTLLKELDKKYNSEAQYKIKYITPERGGKFEHDSNIERQITKEHQVFTDSRRKNRSEAFRQQSFAQLKKLELLILRELEESVGAIPEVTGSERPSFKSVFDKLNELLDNIELKRDNNDVFQIYNKTNSQKMDPESISSGEAELISLGIECLIFDKECEVDKNNILLLDEPDVHLHPDLQARLSHFLRTLLEHKKKAIVVIATHSTAFLGALEDFDGTKVAFMKAGDKELQFNSITDEYRKILPIFGAHPLSNIFNLSPIFLVEGEDDVRIWQQAIRSSNRTLKLYPCDTDGLDNMSKYESDVSKILTCVFDDAAAYSLRDRDDNNIVHNKLNNFTQFVLSCRSPENLLLTDEVLELLETNWDDLQDKINSWLNHNKQHVHYLEMSKFKDEGYDRKSHSLKIIRNDIMHIIGKNIAWEIAIGKTIGKLISDDKKPNSKIENSIAAYLGDDFATFIFKIN